MPITPDNENNLQWGESWSLGKNFAQHEEKEKDETKIRKAKALIVLNQKPPLSLEEIQQISVLSSYSSENGDN